MVQRRAASWVKGDWRQTSSVTGMFQELGWRTLALRRSDARLVMLYKIVHGMVAVPGQFYLPQPGRESRGPDHIPSLKYKQPEITLNIVFSR